MDELCLLKLNFWALNNMHECAVAGVGALVPEISVVVPIYNEVDNIRPFISRVEALFASINVSYELIFCLDPGTDGSEDLISAEISKNKRVKLIVFSRRFGQPAATMAGILSSIGTYCVVIDVDLQDPPELIEFMYRKIREGYDVVYAKRRSRKGETLIKRAVAWVGYWLINKLSDIKIPRNTGDFRIMSRRVVDEISNLKETHGFLRGLVAFVGFRQTFVEYDRDERLSGSGNYNRYLGSLRIGLNGLISFSSRPLFVMAVAGLFLSVFSFGIGLWYLMQKLFGYPLTAGLPSVVIFVTFFSGLQLLGLGLIGEYVGRIYDEVKQRPMFVVDRKINF